VNVVKLSLCVVVGLGSSFFSSLSQGATVVGAPNGDGGESVFSPLDRRLSLLSFSLNGTVTLRILGVLGVDAETAGDALVRPRTASLGIRFCAESIASKSGLGDKS
jgi:hypothetical protein